MDNTASLLPSYSDTDLCSRSWQQSRDILYQKATASLEAKKKELDFYNVATLWDKTCISVGVTVQALSHQTLNICAKQPIQIHKIVFIYHTRTKISSTTQVIFEAWFYFQQFSLSLKIL